MKRILCAALAASMLTVGASAYQVPHRNESSNAITLTNANCDPQAQAEMLQKLGLFMGTNDGFELDRAMTRAEGAAMLYRLLGGSSTGWNGESHPFQDVPAWADNAVGWLYKNRLTYGVSDEEYGSNQPLTADQFAAFLSRAICGRDDLKSEMLTEWEAAVLASRPFLRSHAVAMSTRALTMHGGKGGGSFAEELIDRGLFTEKQFAKAAWGIFPPSFDGSEAEMADVVYAQCHTEGLTEMPDLGTESSLPYFFSYRTKDGWLEIWRVEWLTLDSTRVGMIPLSGMDGTAEYIGNAGGRDYMIITSSKEGEHRRRLYSTTGDILRQELTEKEMGTGSPDIAEGQDTIVLSFKTNACRLDGDGATLFEYPSGEGESKMLDAGEDTYVLQTATEKQTTISCIDQKTGKTLQRYTVQQDNGSDLRTITHTADRDGYRMLYGEAGLYQFDRQTGELEQLLSNATIDMLVQGDIGVYLTHAPGKRIPGMKGPGGDTIVQINHATGKQKTLLNASSKIAIAGFTGLEVTPNVRVRFYMSVGSGSSPAHYFYTYDAAAEKITVTDYKPGDATEEDIGDADEIEYFLGKEIKRIDTLFP